MTEKVILKKYANRRLYDTEKSAYVTLSEVSDMIRQGREIEVVDVKTKEDVTAFILTQVVLEEARNKNVLLPAPVLHLIIRYGDNLLGDFFGDYLHKIVENYLSLKTNFEGQYKKWIDLGMDISGVAQGPMSRMPQFQTFFDQFFSSSKKDEENK